MLNRKCRVRRAHVHVVICAQRVLQNSRRILILNEGTESLFVGFTWLCPRGHMRQAGSGRAILCSFCSGSCNRLETCSVNAKYSLRLHVCHSPAAGCAQLPGEAASRDWSGSLLAGRVHVLTAVIETVCSGQASYTYPSPTSKSATVTAADGAAAPKAAECLASRVAGRLSAGAAAAAGGESSGAGGGEAGADAAVD